MMNTFESLSNNSVCWGSGLLALDVILNGSPSTPAKLTAGGSCGNVMTILSYLGWSSYPVARLKNNLASEEIFTDLERWQVKTDFILKESTGSTSIIIHRIFKNEKGQSVHRFEFRDPTSGTWFPRFIPYLSKQIPDMVKRMPSPHVYYFDRVNRAALDLATQAKKHEAVVFFEPSSIGDPKLFEECLRVTDIIKFSNERIPDYKRLYENNMVHLEIETLGKEGLNFRFAKNKSKWTHMDPFNISNPIDSAGAGDWCTAGIIDNLCKEGLKGLKKWNISEIKFGLQKGQFLGAMNCFFEGARGMMYYVDKASFRSLVGIENLRLDELKKEDLFKSIKSTYKEFDLKMVESSFFDSK